MIRQHQISQFLKLDWESSPGQNPAEGRRIIVDGIVLPKAAIEQEYSLCRSYSASQTRTIKRQQLNKVEKGHGNHSSISRSFDRVNNRSSRMPLEGVLYCNGR
jgi:hypothetical protein